YNGKPMVNSVNGKPESMAVMFPLVKKFGGVLIALTIGEQGIPDTAEGRLAIAADIVAKAEEQGIARRDIIVDPLAMAVSSDPRSALVTLNSIRLIETALGVHTSLGISNISFGLPARDMVTATFFALALQNGLDCAIMNPFSAEMQKIIHAYRVLKGLDENCVGYIAFASSAQAASAAQPAQAASVPAPAAGVSQECGSPLMHAIIKGLKEKAGSLAAAMVRERAPLEVVNAEIIPALDIVGKGFEEKTVFLPQLLMSAEAAKMAFESVKSALASSGVEADKGTVVLATVKGDIHDIGKNIVKVLLSNYGFQVIDLGKDVAPETIRDCALKHDIRLVGLSALMTTTVPAMEETIRLLRESGSGAKVVVGGAVLTQEYADMIHADKYCRDAMETVRYAEEVFSS
ncbi:MAG: cobalamin-dependent protein, partial [Mailhella sp.]|nr:cobalamin-dependent protein [Mailhella sp.]